MTFSDYGSLQATSEAQIFLAQNRSGVKVFLKKYQKLPEDEALLSEPPPHVLVPLDSGATNENAFPFYRSYPSFSQNLETLLDASW
ncbi:MAG: hypothetical protein AABZ60_11495, partial [Planctomycetota bacterium]